MEYTLFLSHNTADMDVVQEVRRRSEASGISIYMFENDAQAGTSIASKLTNAIRASDGLVAVLTKTAAARPAIQQEIGAAVALGKPVFALVEEGVEVAALALLQGLEYIHLDVDRLGDAMLALQRSVTKHRERLRNGLIAAAVLMLIIIALLYYGASE